MFTSGEISSRLEPRLTSGLDIVWWRVKAVRASRYSGRMSRDGVLSSSGRMLASELAGDGRAAFVEDKERESRGGLWRKSSKLLLKMARGLRDAWRSGGEERQAAEHWRRVHPSRYFLSR